MHHSGLTPRLHAPRRVTEPAQQWSYSLSVEGVSLALAGAQLCMELQDNLQLSSTYYYDADTEAQVTASYPVSLRACRPGEFRQRWRVFSGGGCTWWRGQACCVLALLGAYFMLVQHAVL